MRLPKNFFNLLRVILAISLAGVVAGINLPLSTLTLKHWGISSSIIGLAASMMGLSAAVTTPFLPRMVNLFGQIPVLRVSLVTLPLAILALPIFQNLYAWFLFAIHHRIVCNSHLGFERNMDQFICRRQNPWQDHCDIHKSPFAWIHHWCFDHVIYIS